MSKMTENRKKAIENITTTINELLKATENIDKKISIEEGTKIIIVYLNVEGCFENETLKLIVEIVHIADKNALINIKDNSVEFQIRFFKSDV